MRRLPFIVVIILAVLTPAAAAAQTAEPILDPKVWADETVKTLADGDFQAFIANMAMAVDQKTPEQLTQDMQPLQNLVGDRQALYTDLLEEQQLGDSLAEYLYALYYGERNFIFIRLRFARLEEGWGLINISFDADPNDVF